MTDARDEPYRCKWCERWFVVPNLARWHEEHTCVARPGQQG